MDAFEFAQCLQYNEGDEFEVMYQNIFNENESANFIFDANGKLLEFEIEED